MPHGLWRDPRRVALAATKFASGRLFGMRTSTPKRLLVVAVLVAVAAGLSGCGVVAFPVRVTSATAKVVPVAGDVVAYPLDKTADAID